MPRDRYFPKWEVVPGALEDINQKIFVKGMRVEKKDCIDLPPMVYQTIKVPMEGEQARLYKEMKKDLITFLKDKAVTATMAMTKAMRLMQIASGYAKTAEGEEISLGQTPKQVALKELLEELTPNHKVLVWAVWKENYAQIRQVCEELGVGYTEVHGDIPSGQKFANVDRFNTDSKCRVLIGHPGSGGIGINLVVASYSIFYSRNFSLEQSLQAEARNYRGGSLEAGHEKITRIDLVCEGTIDELVSEKLAMKEEIGEKLLSDLSLELAKLESGV
jgi:SNF2 family DNA or RNA helicase